MRVNAEGLKPESGYTMKKKVLIGIVVVAWVFVLLFSVIFPSNEGDETTTNTTTRILYAKC